MKQLIINVDDSAFECVLGMLQLCQKVEVVNTGEMLDSDEQRDSCVLRAIEVLRARNALQYPYDFTWIMVVMDQYLVDGIDGFRSPQAFLAYLAELGIDHLPHRSTISNNYKKVDGVYPDWSFSDTEKPHEVLRRKNVARQFLAAFNKEKVALFDKKFDNV